MAVETVWSITGAQTFAGPREGPADDCAGLGEVLWTTVRASRRCCGGLCGSCGGAADDCAAMRRRCTRLNRPDGGAADGCMACGKCCEGPRRAMRGAAGRARRTRASPRRLSRVDGLLHQEAHPGRQRESPPVGFARELLGLFSRHANLERHLAALVRRLRCPPSGHGPRCPTATTRVKNA